MTNITKALLLGSGLCLAPLGIAAAADNKLSENKGTQAQIEAPPAATAIEEEAVTIPVTIEDIDRKSRTLTIRTADGQRNTIRVPPEVQRFDRLKKGDKVDMGYYKAVAVSVLPAGASATATSTAAQSSDDMPSATNSRSGARQVASSAEVMSVNKRDNTVQLKGENGKPQTVVAQDASVQKKMDNLKPGDVVRIVYSEAVATTIRPRE
jgi:hypothetical protein